MPNISSAWNYIEFLQSLYISKQTFITLNKFERTIPWKPFENSIDIFDCKAFSIF